MHVTLGLKWTTFLTSCKPLWVKVAGHPLIKYEWIVEASSAKQAHSIVKNTYLQKSMGIILKVEEQDEQRTNNAGYKRPR